MSNTVVKVLEGELPSNFKNIYCRANDDSLYRYSCNIELKNADISYEGPDAESIKKIIDENMERWGKNRLPIEIGGKAGNALWDGSRLVSIDDPDFIYAVHEVLLDNGYMFTDLEQLGYIQVSSPEDIERVKQEYSEKQKVV